jgi:DNA polymerase III epsilon subunit-like protein
MNRFGRSLTRRALGCRVRPPRDASREHQVVVVDTETTGLGHNGRPPRPDGIVQVGYAWRNSKSKIIRWAALCNPGESYLRGGRAAEALRINGIRPSEVLGAPAAKVVAAEFRERLEGIRDSSGRELEVRSFNRRFDEPFLRPAPWRLPSQLWGPCLMLAAQSHLGMWKWPKLHEALDYLGITPPPGRAHTAAVDAHAALLVHERISGRHLTR